MSSTSVAHIVTCQVNISSMNLNEQQDILRQEVNRTKIKQVQHDTMTLSSKGFSSKRGVSSEKKDLASGDSSTLSPSTYSFSNSGKVRTLSPPVVLRAERNSSFVNKLNWKKNKTLSVVLGNALIAGDAMAVRTALQKGAQVDKAVGLNTDPVTHVCKETNPAVLEALLQYGAKPDARHGLLAAENGSVQGLDLLIRYTKWGRDQREEIFDCAQNHGRLNVLGYLVSLKDISLKSHVNYRLLKSFENDDLHGFKLLLSLETMPVPAECRPVVKVRGEPDPPLLQRAIIKGQPEYVEALLRYTSNRNQLTFEGDKNLLAHAASTSEEMTRLLLEAGADPNARSKDLNAPIHYAAKNGSVGILDVLLQHNADIESRDAFGATPLMIAAESSSSAGMEFLLARQADPDTTSLNGSNIIHYAVMSGQIANVQLGLKHKSEDGQISSDGFKVWTPRRANRQGWSPAAIALQQGHWGIVEMFLRSGVSSKPLNINDDIALLLIAAAQTDVAALRLVLSHGADANDTFKGNFQNAVGAMCLYSTMKSWAFPGEGLGTCKVTLTKAGARACWHSTHGGDGTESIAIRDFIRQCWKSSGVLDNMR